MVAAGVFAACVLTASSYAQPVSPGKNAKDKSPTTAAVQPATAPKTAVAETAIVPGERIGAMSLTGRIDDFVARFGAGKRTSAGIWRGAVMSTWDAMSLNVVTDVTTGNILWISIGHSYANPWTMHATAEGIRLGTPESELLAAMGTPERTVTGAGARSLYYERRGIHFLFADSGAMAAKITGMRIAWPSVPRGDLLIVPGERISGIAVGAAIGDALAALGDGYLKQNAGSAGTNAYYWPHLNLAVVEHAGRVSAARVIHPGPNDAQVLRYATSEGVGMGSTADAVRKAYGEPEQTGAAGRNAELVQWAYPSRGIGFALSDIQVVYVEVTSPRTP